MRNQYTEIYWISDDNLRTGRRDKTDQKEQQTFAKLVEEYSNLFPEEVKDLGQNRFEAIIDWWLHEKNYLDYCVEVNFLWTTKGFFALKEDNDKKQDKIFEWLNENYPELNGIHSYFINFALVRAHNPAIPFNSGFGSLYKKDEIST